jgi:hypothetical protein
VNTSKEENVWTIQEDEGKKETNAYMYIVLVNCTTEKKERRKTNDINVKDTIKVTTSVRVSGRRNVKLTPLARIIFTLQLSSTHTHLLSSFVSKKHLYM